MDRSHVDGGLAHVDQEVAEPGVFDRTPVGAGDEDAHVGVIGARVPHLLPVDDPLVAVTDGGGRQPCEVGSRARFGEELAPGEFARQRPAEVPPLQVVRRVVVHRRRCEPEPATERDGDAAGSPNGGMCDPVGPRREAPAEPLGRPRWHRPPGVDEAFAPLEKREVGFPRVREPGEDLALDVLLVDVRGVAESCHRQLTVDRRADGSGRCLLRSVVMRSSPPRGP